jgi:hypothetical protein
MRNTRFPSDETMSAALDRVGAALDRWHKKFLRRRYEESLTDMPVADRHRLNPRVLRREARPT